MTKISTLTSLSSTPASGDQIAIVDTSDTGQGPSGSTKKIGAAYFTLADGSVALVTGGGTIALGGYTLTIGSSGTVDLNGNGIDLSGNLTGTGGVFNAATNTLTLTGSLTSGAGTLALGGQTLTIDTSASITGGGTLELDTFTLTVPTTGTAVVGTGTADRVASWSDANTIAASSLAKTNTGILTLTSDTSDVTITFPVTGTAVVGTGTASRIASWSDGNTVEASTLIKSGVGVLTLDCGDAYTITVNSAGTLDLGGNTLALTGDLSSDGGTLTLGTNELTIDADVSITGGGTLELDTYTLTAAKSGTIATIADVTGGNTFYIPLVTGSDIIETSTFSYKTNGWIQPDMIPDGATVTMIGVYSGGTSGFTGQWQLRTSGGGTVSYISCPLTANPTKVETADIHADIDSNFSSSGALFRIAYSVNSSGTAHLYYLALKVVPA